MTSNLDLKLAGALANKVTKASVFSDLLLEIDHALPTSLKAIEAERVRMLDPTNPAPGHCKDNVDKLTMTHDRLTAAVPILRQRYAQAERRESVEAFKLRYNPVVEKHNKCSETLMTLYHDFCEHVIPLLDAAAKLNTEIRQINAEAHDKRLTEFPTIATVAEYLISQMVLPSGNGQNYWPSPATQNSVAAQWGMR